MQGAVLPRRPDQGSHQGHHQSRRGAMQPPLPARRHRCSEWPSPPPSCTARPASRSRSSRRCAASPGPRLTMCATSRAMTSTAASPCSAPTSRISFRCPPEYLRPRAGHDPAPSTFAMTSSIKRGCLSSRTAESVRHFPAGSRWRVWDNDTYGSPKISSGGPTFCPPPVWSTRRALVGSNPPTLADHGCTEPASSSTAPCRPGHRVRNTRVTAW